MGIWSTIGGIGKSLIGSVMGGVGSGLSGRASRMVSGSTPSPAPIPPPSASTGLAMGEHMNSYWDKIAPDTTQYERLGSPGSGGPGASAQMSSSGIAEASKYATRQQAKNASLAATAPVEAAKISAQGNIEATKIKAGAELEKAKMAHGPASPSAKVARKGKASVSGALDEWLNLPVSVVDEVKAIFNEKSVSPEFKRLLSKGGLNVAEIILNAAMFGVPAVAIAKAFRVLKGSGVSSKSLGWLQQKAANQPFVKKMRLFKSPNKRSKSNTFKELMKSPSKDKKY